MEGKHIAERAGEAGLLQYELENNRLLNALRMRREFSDVLQYINEKKATLLVPQSVTLSDLHVNRSFIETHVMMSFDSYPGRFVSVNGVRAVYSTDDCEAIHVVCGPPTDDNELIEMVVNPLSAFLNGSVFDQYDPAQRNPEEDVYVLRHATLQIADVEAVMLLVSRPLTFAGCPWTVDEYGASATTPTSSFIGQESPSVGRSHASQNVLELNTEASRPKSAEVLLIDLGDDSSQGMQPQPGLVNNASPLSFGRDQGVGALRPAPATAQLLPSTQADMPETSMHAGEDSVAHASARRKGNSTMGEFKEKMKDPSCGAFVRAIRTFIDAVKEDGETLTPDVLSERFQAFLQIMDDRFSTHPLWEHDVDLAMEGLEKYVLSVPEVHALAFHRLEDRGANTRLRQRIDALGFVTPKHLDIHATGNIDVALEAAGNELQAMNKYRAPRAKLVCLVNCCKIIFTRLLNTGEGQGPASADDFLPMLIYVILKSNPELFKANLMYIERFRYQQRLGSEQAYYYTTVLSAVEFIDRVDATMLSIDADEFQKLLADAEKRIGAYVGPKKTPASNPAPVASVASSTSRALASLFSRRDADSPTPARSNGKAPGTYFNKLQSYLSDPRRGFTRPSAQSPGQGEATTQAAYADTFVPPTTLHYPPQMHGPPQPYRQLPPMPPPEYLDRETLQMLLESMCVNYERPNQRLRGLTEESLSSGDVYELLYEYRRLAAYTDHIMETLHNLNLSLKGPMR